MVGWIFGGNKIMGNMSYCRFENTYNALRDCQEDMGTTPFINLSKTEDKYRLKLIQVCKQIADDWADNE